MFHQTCLVQLHHYVIGQNAANTSAYMLRTCGIDDLKRTCSIQSKLCSDTNLAVVQKASTGVVHPHTQVHCHVLQCKWSSECFYLQPKMFEFIQFSSKNEPINWFSIENWINSGIFELWYAITHSTHSTDIQIYKIC